MHTGTCTKCGRTELAIYSNGYCRTCSAEYKKAQRHAGKVKVAMACVRCHRDDIPLYKSNGYCKACWKVYMDEWRGKNPEKVQHQNREVQKSYNVRLRAEVLAAYGGQCICCGENHIEFLAVDKITGGDKKWRMENLGSQSSASFYRYLRREVFPPEYQLLCHNCNDALSFYGYCPHGNLPPRPMLPRGRRKVIAS